MFMDVPSDISSSLLHLQPVFDQRVDAWVLKSLAFTASSAEETVIIRNFKPGTLKQISTQPFVVFTPVPSVDYAVIDPFKTPMVHTAFFADPVEGWIMMMDPRGVKENVQGTK